MGWSKHNFQSLVKRLGTTNLVSTSALGFTPLLQPAELSDFPHPHIGITDNGLQSVTVATSPDFAPKPGDFGLQNAYFEYPAQIALSHGSIHSTPQPISTQPFIIHAWDFDMDINAIKQ